MLSDMKKAMELLQNGGYSCVLCKNETVYTSGESGVRPIMGFLTQGVELQGFCAADKIVGKAAAMLFILAGIKEVHATVMSRTAVSALSAHGIALSCDTLVDYIINRAGTDMCPMEKAVRDIDDPAQAYTAIQKTILALSSGKEA